MNPYNFFTNSFAGYCIDNYNDVLNYAAPSDRSAVIFANLNEGMLWSKKLINGIPYIQPYRLIPINNEGKPPEPIQKLSTDEKLDKLIDILTRRELNNERQISDEHVNESAKNSESSGI